MSVPYRIHSLLLLCYEPEGRQFRGIDRLAAELERKDGFCTYRWDGNDLDLSRRRRLARTIVSGHGAPDEARYSSPVPLRPDRLRLPSDSRLYLLGCYQGKPAFRRRWAEGCGIPEERVFGSAGETESALSTCLLLHLLEDGMDSIDRWFSGWLDSNDYLRPHFPLIRRLYRECGQMPLETLERLKIHLDLSPILQFIEIGERYPGYLRNLLEEGMG